MFRKNSCVDTSCVRFLPMPDNLTSPPETSSSSEEGLSRSRRPILCCYRNGTDRMVIVRVRGMATFFLERVVFPFEIMTFHCPRECEVEILTRTPTGLEESEWVAAEELMADQPWISEGGWRPSRSIRKVNLRSSDSSICMDYR